MTVISRRRLLTLGVAAGASAALAGLAACGSASPAPASSSPAAPASPSAATSAKPAASSPLASAKPAASPASASAAASGAAAPKKASFTLAMPELEVAYVAPILTVEALRQKGYDAKYKNYGESNLVTQSAVTGETQIVHGALAAMISAIATGAPLTALLTDQRFAWVLASKTSIQSPKELDGKVVAVGQPGSTTDLLTSTTIKKYGIKPQLVRNSASEQSMQALALGKVDAAGYSIQDQINADQKVPGKTKILVNYAEELGPDFLGYAIWGRNDLIQANPDLQKDLMATMEEVHQKLYADKAYALSQIKRVMPDLDAKVAEGTYDAYTKSEIWPKKTALSAKALQSSVTFLTDNGMLKQQAPPLEKWAKPTA